MKYKKNLFHVENVSTEKISKRNLLHHYIAILI